MGQTSYPPGSSHILQEPALGKDKSLPAFRCHWSSGARASARPPFYPQGSGLQGTSEPQLTAPPLLGARGNQGSQLCSELRLQHAELPISVSACSYGFCLHPQDLPVNSVSLCPLGPVHIRDPWLRSELSQPEACRLTSSLEGQEAHSCCLSSLVTKQDPLGGPPRTDPSPDPPPQLLSEIPR